ncbi:outer membrane protein [Deinococcus arenicola]|uniref:S-layer homology domain-containing protein n=1 Tax=Deinococcus arenicola TaxID=2994950 RepID=A0ABU4DPH0_9DEIO|nr:S-layer homology domain-containing protein [Deinococcus sp. ZS9-10]MDV6374333.1 S-layer homology domain-containing protein [Deinococcus sp. ZS9-10]
MRKSLILLSTLALSLGVAGAQDAAPVTSPVPVTISDVPAGHWAKDAVDRIVQCGLIQGFPDGTYRGNENLTRYQAALIFYRLLQTDALSTCGMSKADMATVANGMQEVSPEMTAIAGRVTDLEKLNADQQARLDALEAKINEMGNMSATGDTAAMTARLDALEAAVKNIPAGPAGPVGPAGPAGPAGAAGAASTTTTVTPAPVTPATPAPGTTVVIGEPAMDMSMASAKTLYVGITGGVNFVDKTSQCINKAQKTNSEVSFCVTAGAVIGSTSVFGPIGARVAAQYQPGYNAIHADVNATYNINAGNLHPYVGAGLGLTSSDSRTGTNAKATDTYINGLVGLDFRVTDSIAAFVEGNGRYYLTNKGFGTGLSDLRVDGSGSTGTGDKDSSATKTTKGFGGAVKAGLKFYF